KIRAERVFPKSNQARLEQVKGNIPHAEANQTNNPQRASDKHGDIPSVPGRGWRHILLAIHVDRNEFRALRQRGIIVPKTAFEVGELVLVSFGHLPELFPFYG